MKGSVTIPVDDFLELIRCRDCIDEIYETAFVVDGAHPWVAVSAERALRNFDKQRYREMTEKLLVKHQIEKEHIDDGE